MGRSQSGPPPEQLARSNDAVRLCSLADKTDQTLEAAAASFARAFPKAQHGEAEAARRQACETIPILLQVRPAALVRPCRRACMDAARKCGVAIWAHATAIRPPPLRRTSTCSACPSACACGTYCGMPHKARLASWRAAPLCGSSSR